MAEEIKVDSTNAKASLQRFVRGVTDKVPLLRVIAASMMVSIRKTFREQGSPADSWAPLAPSTLKNPTSKASTGRKILILSGRLLNSIQATTSANGIVIGTNLVYARVQQLGSDDRRGGAIGPQARLPGRGVIVETHLSTFTREIHYTTRDAGTKRGMPVAMRSGIHEVYDKNGNVRKVSGKYAGPRQQRRVVVDKHTRYQNIPGRPYLVFRPEDPGKIRQLVAEYTGRQAQLAGLGSEGGV